MPDYPLEYPLLSHWVGFVCIAIFVVGYYFIATEEKYQLNKAKPALATGTFLFAFIGLYLYFTQGFVPEDLHKKVEQVILEIAEIFFFLFVAMVYIETLIEQRVFSLLRYKLVSQGYSYKKIFWLTGLFAFFLSPIADNLTTALILSTVLITVDKDNKKFLVLGAINIVVAANAGGALSPFGDITTFMVWAEHKASFVDFLYLFPASVVNWVVSAYLLALFVPEGKPTFDISKEKKVKLGYCAYKVIFLGIFTIFLAVTFKQILHFPPMWGMMLGLALLKLCIYFQKKKENMDIFHNIARVEFDTLLFFFGILSAVGALQYIGYLATAAKFYDTLSPTALNIGVGLLSAIIDNVPVMYVVLKSNPNIEHIQWMLVTLTAGVGGSLISFGSAAGVGVMGKMRGIYTFGSHMKYAWAVMLGYMASIGVWYLQMEVLQIHGG